MRTTPLAVLAVVGLLAASVCAEPLEQSYSALSQSLKPQAAALQQTANSGAAKIVSAKNAARVRDFYLEHERGFWRLVPGPAGHIRIDVREGDEVRLELVNREFGPGRHPHEATLDIEWLDSSVNGRPSHGVHVWLPRPGERARVVFRAMRPRIYPMMERGRDIGYLTIHR
jgi:hypothetical protein